MSLGFNSGDGAGRRAAKRAGLGRRTEPVPLEPVLELAHALSPEIDAARLALGVPSAAAAAMRELLTVHRIEQARLLLRASQLRAASTPLGGLFLALCALDLREADWRAAAAEELDACLFDGWEVPAPLAECSARSRADWASARGLARAALALRPSLAARIQLARAELCEGSIGKAREMMQRLQATHPAGGQDRELRESLALASEAEGRWEDAGLHYRALCARTDVHPAGYLASLAASLAAALRVGDLVRAQAVRAQLIESAESTLEDDLWRTQVFSRLQARIRFHRRAGRWHYADEVRLWIEAWQRAGLERRPGAVCRWTATLTRALL
jgi:hypothetical protein